MAKKKKKVRPHYVAKANRKKEPMPTKEKIGWIAGCGVLLLGIILFIVLYDDGSLPVRGGVIAGKQDNWIISKLQTARSSKYFKLGEVLATMEGFDKNLESSAGIKTDANETGFWYDPIDPDSQIDSYYITGVASSAADMAENLPLQYSAFYPQSQISEPKTAEIAGVEAQYMIAMMPVVEEEETLAGEEAEGETEDAAEVAAEGQAEDAVDTAAESAVEATAEREQAATEIEGEQAENVPPEETTEPEDAADQEAPEEQPEPDDRTATQQILCYIPSVRDSSILICVNVKIAEDMPEWTEDVLLAMAKSIGDKIAVGK